MMYDTSVRYAAYRSFDPASAPLYMDDRLRREAAEGTPRSPDRSSQLPQLRGAPLTLFFV